VQSEALGWMVGVNAARLFKGEVHLTDPPRSAIGAFARYVSSVGTTNYQPVNITFALLEPLDSEPARSLKRKRDRHLLQVKLAVKEWDEWISTNLCGLSFAGVSLRQADETLAVAP